MLPDDHHCGQDVSLSRSVPTDELAVFEYQADAVKVYVVVVCFFVVHIIVLLNDVCGLLALNNKRASLVRRALLSKEAWRIVSRGRKEICHGTYLQKLTLLLIPQKRVQLLSSYGITLFSEILIEVTHASVLGSADQRRDVFEHVAERSLLEQDALFFR